MLFLIYNDKKYKLGEPRSISRGINIKQNLQPNAFDLTKFSQTAFQNQFFTGDTGKGGSCNVNILNFTPHNLTHIETPMHLKKEGIGLDEIPRSNLMGVSYLVDLSNISFKDNCVKKEHIEQLDLLKDIKILIVKTKYSELDQYFDFSNTNPIHFDPKFMEWLTENFPNIKLLITDLPSIDKENDGGKLLGHKNYFNFNEHERGDKKAIVELAYCKGVESGIYYTILTPSKIDTDAILTDIFLFDLFKN